MKFLENGELPFYWPVDNLCLARRLCRRSLMIRFSPFKLNDKEGLEIDSERRTPKCDGEPMDPHRVMSCVWEPRDTTLRS